ncbi:MAG: hypothetical protein ACTSWR_04035 [Candidatus Helarchaeota archaeon]
MQSKGIYRKFYDNYIKLEIKKQEKIIPASFNEWLKFDLKYKTGVFATTCPFCSSKNVKKGIKLDTTNAGLRDNRYIEYRCNDCGGYFLI